MNVLVLGTLIGAVLLALLVWDLHATVFVPRGPAGPLARRLYRLCWRVWHRVVGDRSPGARRRLAWLGPLLIPLTVLLWAGLLLLGFMLLLLPYARNFEVDGAVAFAPWFNALYISAYSVSTLGVGDVTPNGELARLIMVVAAASGFVLITVAVTYLLSVYGSLERMTALAFEIHRFVGRGEAGTPPDVLVTVATTDSADELSGWLSSTATSLSQVVQSDDEFPLLHFFHMPDERALPLALSDLLEVVTLCRTVLCPQTFPALAGGLVSAGTERVARSYFIGLDRKFRDSRLMDQDARVTQERRAAFEWAWARLSAAGVPLRPQDEAWTRYAATRVTWDAASARLRSQFGYPAFDDARRDEVTA